MIYLLNWRVWTAIGLLAILASTHWKAYHSGAASVQAAWDARTVAEQAEYLKTQQEVRDKEATLQADKESLRRIKNAQIAKLDADLAGALERLRDRPERPRESDLPTVAGIGPDTGCTGAQLYRQDAAAFIGESRRAQLVLIDLAQCQAQYDKAREAMNPQH